MKTHQGVSVEKQEKPLSCLASFFLEFLRELLRDISNWPDLFHFECYYTQVVVIFSSAFLLLSFGLSFLLSFWSFSHLLQIIWRIILHDVTAVNQIITHSKVVLIIEASLISHAVALVYAFRIRASRLQNIFEL